MGLEASNLMAFDVQVSHRGKVGASGDHKTETWLG